MFAAHQTQPGLIFVLIGPPGAGKNAIMNAVLARVGSMHQLATATTRKKRLTEQEGREHLFVSRPEFQRLIEKDALLEWQVIHEELYGIPRASVESVLARGTDLIADIDVLGAAVLRKTYPDSAVLVFIQPESPDELRERMEKRGDAPEEIEKRIRRVAMEMEYAPECDYLITNGEGELAAASETLYGIVLAERSRHALLRLRAAREAQPT